MDVTWKDLALPLAAGAALYVANTAFLGWLFSLDPSLQGLIYGRGPWWLRESMLVKTLYVGIIAPFIEELAFRRLLLGFFIARKKAVAGLLLSSILFGAWHLAFGWGVLKALDMTVVGLIFGLTYWRWKFKGSLLAHYANNLLAVIAMSYA